MKNTIITSVIYVFILLNNIPGTSVLHVYPEAVQLPAGPAGPAVLVAVHQLIYNLLFLNLRDCGKAWIVY